MNKTISNEYLELQKELHKNPYYGIASVQYAPYVDIFFKEKSLSSICDYGAGKQNLKKALDKLGLENYAYYPYDPAFPDYGPPREADLVCCIDVLEHIEEDYLDNVLEELKRITLKYGIFTIHTGPAMKFLKDGRNAHLIQKPSSWWLPSICSRFEIIRLASHSRGFILTVKKLEELI